MGEEILALAKLVTGAGETEWEYLEKLCRAELDALGRRLRGTLEKTKENAFVCAAAWLAAADYFSAKGAAGAASWSAGDVSVKEKGGSDYAAAAALLRRAAHQLLADCLEDDDFAFQGVRG